MQENQFIIFKLEEEQYGINIITVQEITQFKECNKISNMPHFVEGIINLRGKIVPIICLKKRFKIEERQINTETRIIVVNINDKQVGFIVDEASEVISLNENDIELPPDMIASVERQYITGIGKLKDKIIILLDLEKIMTNDENAMISEIKQKGDI
ncbi:purine-binding chemotaxis protein CheW [Lutibacter sp. B2]|nr:purine-binding chemotaxis protein CheW [Lutibacter sp. B2]